jgi:hypothetical protein
VGLFALVMSHGCECEDPAEPEFPEDWSLFECTVTPPSLGFGSVPVGSGVELQLGGRIRGNPGWIEVVPSQSCPSVSVVPLLESQVWDGPLDFTVTYRPEAPGVLDCDLELEIVIRDGPEGDPACPSVPLSGSAFDATTTWTPCGGPEELGHDWAAVYGLSPEEVYMAGAEGRVARYAGGCSWEAIDPGDDLLGLTGIWATAFGADDAERSLWAVGNRVISGRVLRSSGDAAWTVEDESDRFTYGAVWGSDECDVYVAGQGIASDFPNAQRFDCEGSESFQIDFGMSEVTGLSGTGPDDVWAVLAQPTFQVYRYDGSAWRLETDPLVNRPLHDVWATASGHVWVVGEEGAVFHWDGSGWIDESRSVEGTFYGVWAAESGEVLAVGEAGLAWFYDGTAWIEEAPGTTEDLLDVWGASATELFVVGNQAVYRAAPTR